LNYTVLDDDRYGRERISAEEEVAMLREGVAVIFSQERIASEWVEAEASARREKRGIWGEKGFVLTAENADSHTQEFHVVEGTITRIYEAKHATYLDFGEDWHTDFSVTIAGRARRSFETLLEQVKVGTHVAVRGTLVEENGPMIHLNRPEQLEVR
jgi:hypothetical protein